MCSDCINCMKNFDHYDIAYEFMDCCASLRNLSIFLQMRDENSVFDHLKEKDIPLIEKMADDIKASIDAAEIKEVL